jgi:hypothetical protein
VRRRRRSLARSSDPPPKNKPVDSQVQSANQDPQPELILTGQARRVENGDEIMIDETPGVPSLPAENPETDFQRGQGTNPPRKFYEPSPEGHRDMNEGDAGVPDDENPTQHHEEDECQMKGYE